MKFSVEIGSLVFLKKKKKIPWPENNYLHNKEKILMEISVMF